MQHVRNRAVYARPGSAITLPPTASSASILESSARSCTSNNHGSTLLELHEHFASQLQAGGCRAAQV
jgi:hypothetical protein